MNDFRIDFGTYQTFRQDWPKALRDARILRQLWPDTRIVNPGEVDGAEDASAHAQLGLTAAQLDEWAEPWPPSMQRLIAASSLGQPFADPDPVELDIAVTELKKIEMAEKAAALDLLEQWLDVHPSREVTDIAKLEGKIHIAISADSEESPHTSETQETLASAIRTVLQIAISNGDGLK